MDLQAIGASTMAVDSLGPPQVVSFLSDGVKNISSGTSNARPAESTAYTHAFLQTMTYQMVPSIIRSTNYAIADAKLMVGVSPPALPQGMDMAATTTPDIPLQVANKGDTGTGAARCVIVSGAILVSNSSGSSDSAYVQNDAVFDRCQIWYPITQTTAGVVIGSAVSGFGRILS